MNDEPRIFGHVITAMVTPFTTSGNLNIDEAIRIARYLAENGSDTVLLAGTTGESPTLTHQEEYDLFKEVKNALPAHVKVMAGTGSNSTKTAIEATKKAETLGVDGVLQVVPYYNKPSQEGLYRHFKGIAEETSLPVLLYNIPGRTGTTMQPETMARLAAIENIIGVKEAAGSVKAVKAIRQATPTSFEIYSGDDALTLEFLKEGACGVVSVASHIAGLKIQKMVQLFLGGQLEEAASLSNELQPLFDVLFITSNPSPVKYAMQLLGFQTGAPRLPLIEVNDHEKEKIKKVVDAL